ncbi:MAG: hypothetical protein IJN54_09170 [Lachnospiraceae bacterium]|nr:hypothetical protein [Lachnospiraceae bacterium]
MKNFNVDRMVDAEPNKQGTYTVLKIGISFLHGKESRFWMIKDKSNQREYWTEMPNWMDATNNEYTNIGIHNGGPVFPENIKINNITLMHLVYEKCINEMDELIHFYLKDFGILYSEDGEIDILINRKRYYGSEECTKKRNEFNDKVNSLKKRYNLLNLYRDFDSVLADGVLKLENEKGVFYANMECCEETVYSYDKEIIEEYVWCWFNTNLNCVTNEEEY